MLYALELISEQLNHSVGEFYRPMCTNITLTPSNLNNQASNIQYHKMHHEIHMTSIDPKMYENKNFISYDQYILYAQ